MTKRHRSTGAAFALVAVVLMLPAGAPAAERRIGAFDTFFSPKVITRATPGDTLVWDIGQGTHTITSYTGPSFDSGPRTAPSTFSANFPGGTVRYRCTIHSTLSASNECTGMCGWVTQEDSVDLERPTVRITMPSLPVAAPLPRTNGQTITNPVMVGGVATDNVAVARVALRFYDTLGTRFDVPQTTCTRCGTSGDVTWQVEVSLLPGHYTLEAIATDTSENSRVSDRVTVVVL